jgi:hypothetical protein
MTTVKIFEVIYDKFEVDIICIAENYLHKYMSKLHNY